MVHDFQGRHKEKCVYLKQRDCTDQRNYWTYVHLMTQKAIGVT